MEQALRGSIQRVESLIQVINASASGLNKQENVFRPVRTQPIQFSCAEAGFLRVVSWLYILYYESGKVNVGFLLDHLKTYASDTERECRDHYVVVHALRTTMQHSLNPDEDRDMALCALAERWLSAQCGDPDPAHNEQWLRCLSAVLMETESFLISLRQCLCWIAEDEFCTQIVDDWNRRCGRYHPLVEFERIVSIVASDFGQDYLDIAKYTKKYYEQWAKEISTLKAGYDFETETRKRVEMTFLVSPVLPLTGDDIKREFQIGASRELGDLVRKAKRLYENDPCNRDELLERLRQSLGVEP